MDVKDQLNNTGVVQELPPTTTMDVKFQTFTIKLVFNNTEVELHVPNRRSHHLQWKVLPVTGHSKYTVDFPHPGVTVGRQCSVRVHVDGVHIKALNCSINQAALRPERDPKFGNTRRWMQIGQFDTGKLSLGFMLRLDGMVEEEAESGGGGDNNKATAHCQLSRVAVFVDKQQQEGGGGQSSWFTD